ncbi:gluconate 2-dehydrogenase subunit 3 family protein [Sphingomonas piscis]|uniref:Gluconate 2-dehydrogenase subunit 3 family protein n=1 Tax=Sphingomonas piscis TaxID=2714943 RepID=A0A6G7YNF6_9SPHN|nr:gluconate 2-dehydrogenase subunit 3 family protein [Sphingomonas piscis]QIK78280.1 gluconate 2-dehydrogenase subunit 3 family protein [Sphingomonas piscis]
MRNAVLLVGGTLAATSPAAALAQSKSKKPARFFSPAQNAVMAETVDIIIPRTDTPGAKDAGVPQAFDAMMRNWANAEHRAQYVSVIDEIGGMGLMKLKPAERLELIRKFDADKLQAGDQNYRRFKDLTMTLYYLSEPGATKELRYELIPGKWEPWIEVTPDTRTWAA